MRKNFRISHTKGRAQLEGKYVDKATGKGYRIFFNPANHAITHIKPAQFKRFRPQVIISIFSQFDCTQLFTQSASTEEFGPFPIILHFTDIAPFCST